MHMFGNWFTPHLLGLDPYKVENGTVTWENRVNLLVCSMVWEHLRVWLWCARFGGEPNNGDVVACSSSVCQQWSENRGDEGKGPSGEGVKGWVTGGSAWTKISRKSLMVEQLKNYTNCETSQNYSSTGVLGAYEYSQSKTRYYRRY
jgi:hypothetical protein